MFLCGGDRMRSWGILLVIFAVLCTASMASAAVFTVPSSWTAGGFWVNTGINLNQGDALHITATGSWSATLGEFYGADGTDYQWVDQFLNANYWAGSRDHFGALIAYVGDTPPAIGSYENLSVDERQAYINSMMLLGSDVTVTAPATGKLWLAMNDDAYSGNLDDNAGSLSVVVKDIFTYNPDNGHYYKLVGIPGGITWTNANAAAGQMTYNGMQGHLATINSAQENTFLTQYSHIANRCWLGGIQLPGSAEPDGGWSWITGEPWSYSNWDDWEPNNTTPYEDVMELMQTGKWNDRIHTGTYPYGYIVEFEPGPVVNPANGHSYKVVDVPGGVTWIQARDAAIAAGGYLATLTSADEGSFVFNLAYNDSQAWVSYGDWRLGPFIGGYQPDNSVEPDGGWQWVTGETWSFSDWNANAFSAGAPGLNSAENKAHLAYISGTLEPTWNDVSPGSTLRGYVIEWDPPVLTDDFNDNSTNYGLWSTPADSGVTVNETNQQVEISYDPSASGGQFGAGYFAKLGIKGDFDIQVDYNLLDWPAGNGVRIGLVPTWWSAQRTSQGIDQSTPDEIYAMDSYYGTSGGFSTTDTSGKLRIVRTGSLVTSLYYSGDRWIPIHSYDYGASGLSDVPWLAISSWSHSSTFSKQAVRIAFDNFKVNFGHIEPNYQASRIGAARAADDGTGVFVDGAVVTADQNLIPGCVFIESPDRSSGIRLITSENLQVGDRVSVLGNKRRVNGEYIMDNPTILSKSTYCPLDPVFLTTRSLGNDLDEMLEYVGINTTGLLVRIAGKVTNVFSDSHVIYVDDGFGYEDGLLMNQLRGIRVKLPASVTLPTKGKHAIVTGIARVEKYTLTNYGEVNGYWREPGTELYVPSVWVRDIADLDIF